MASTNPPQELTMTTLHIEHPITDLNVWLAAFDRMAEARTNAGVISQRVLHLVDDPNYIFVDLDFTTTEEARRFPHLPRAERLVLERQRSSPRRDPADQAPSTSSGSVIHTMARALPATSTPPVERNMGAAFLL
jgi:hypothetical protein